MTHRILQPDGWVKPIGYSNGIVVHGRFFQVGGQIGWDEAATFLTDDFMEQVEQALQNAVAVLEAGGARPEHIVQMTWYVTSRDEYRSRLREVGQVYRATIGRHFGLNWVSPHLRPVIEMTPMRRSGTPGEITKSVAFPASDASVFITGEDFVIDGGFTAGAAYRKLEAETGMYSDTEGR